MFVGLWHGRGKGVSPKRLRHSRGRRVTLNERSAEKPMRTLTFVLSAVIAGCLLHGGRVAAQGSVATYSKEAMEDLGNLLKKASKDGFAMETKTTTIFGGWLPKGSKSGKEPWVPILILNGLDPNKTYRIVAAGDNDAKDLDLRIVDPDGKVVVTDESVQRNSEVTFRPTRRQNYTIQLRLYDSGDNCICVGAVLAK
jgi:hypothetical protein